MDQDHAFPDQHLLQLGTVVSRVHCARIIYCVARQEVEESVIIDPFCAIIVEKYFEASK